MEKGLITKEGLNALMEDLKKLLTEKEVKNAGLIVVGVTIVARLLDDGLADKLPEQFKIDSQALSDALLVSKDYDQAVGLAVVWVMSLVELFKKEETE